MSVKQQIVKTKIEICSKIMRSEYYDYMDPPLDLRIDTEDVMEDVLKLRQLQDLEYDMRLYGEFKADDDL